MWSVFFVFLSYLDRDFVVGDFLSRALEAEEESKEMFSMINGTFCAKMSAVGENFLYQVSGGAEVVRSMVSPAGRLVNCSVTVNQMHVKSFVHECRLGLKEQRAGQLQETRFTHVDEAKLMCLEFKKRSERAGRLEEEEKDAELQEKAVKRSKRGFTYPGTLWCGAGNMADNDDQLGDFAETDSCCRTHDHCPHVIHAFSSNYGYTNFKWHSICHCDCDQALRSCLRKVNDTSSRVVGQAFFNVIGVPCFEFAFEEQCAERHWYGTCKRYEKFPIAVLKDAIPYDFGGIAVIDELTVAPPKKKGDEEEKTESTTQSTMSGPEEPSLTNVVNAAEDFIKVLATVSTSQSSTADSAKGETQSSEKKKRKNTGKKKKNTKKQKRKGKGRKRKQKAVVKIEEGATVSPPGSKAEEVISLSNFISESHKDEQPSRNTNRDDDNEYKLGNKEESSNEVMKDEPAMDKEMLPITLTVKGQKKTVKMDDDTFTTIVIPHTEENRLLRKERRKKSKKIPLPPPEEVVSNFAPPVIIKDNLNAIPVPTIITTTPTAQPGQQSFSTANTPIVIPKVKRNRSKERGGRESWKKRGKVSSASPIVANVHENSYTDNLKVIPLTGAPTVPSVNTTEQQVSHRPDTYVGRMPAPNPSFNILKRRSSKDRRRGRRRKTALSLSSENRFENLLHIFTTADTQGELKSPTTTAEDIGTQSEKRLFTTVIPSIITKRSRQTIRQQRKPRKNDAPNAVSDRVSIPKLTEHTAMTFTITPSKVTTTKEINMKGSENVKTAAIALSIERVKEQFSRKKRRKAALSVR